MNVNSSQNTYQIKLDPLGRSFTLITIKNLYWRFLGHLFLSFHWYSCAKRLWTILVPLAIFGISQTMSCNAICWYKAHCSRILSFLWDQVLLLFRAGKLCKLSIVSQQTILDITHFARAQCPCITRTSGSRLLCALLLFRLRLIFNPFSEIKSWIGLLTCFHSYIINTHTTGFLTIERNLSTDTGM